MEESLRRHVGGSADIFKDDRSERGLQELLKASRLRSAVQEGLVERIACHKDETHSLRLLEGSSPLSKSALTKLIRLCGFHTSSALIEQTLFSVLPISLVSLVQQGSETPETLEEMRELCAQVATSEKSFLRVLERCPTWFWHSPCSHHKEESSGGFLAWRESLLHEIACEEYQVKPKAVARVLLHSKDPVRLSVCKWLRQQGMSEVLLDGLMACVSSQDSLRELMEWWPNHDDSKWLFDSIAQHTRERLRQGDDEQLFRLACLMDREDLCPQSNDLLEKTAEEVCATLQDATASQAAKGQAACLLRSIARFVQDEDKGEIETMLLRIVTDLGMLVPVTDTAFVFPRTIKGHLPSFALDVWACFVRYTIRLQDEWRLPILATDRQPPSRAQEQSQEVVEHLFAISCNEHWKALNGVINDCALLQQNESKYPIVKQFIQHIEVGVGHHHTRSTKGVHASSLVARLNPHLLGWVLRILEATEEHHSSELRVSLLRSLNAIHMQQEEGALAMSIWGPVRAWIARPIQNVEHLSCHCKTCSKVCFQEDMVVAALLGLSGERFTETLERTLEEHRETIPTTFAWIAERTKMYLSMTRIRNVLASFTLMCRVAVTDAELQLCTRVAKTIFKRQDVLLLEQGEEGLAMNRTLRTVMATWIETSRNQQLVQRLETLESNFVRCKRLGEKFLRGLIFTVLCEAVIGLMNCQPQRFVFCRDLALLFQKQLRHSPPACIGFLRDACLTAWAACVLPFLVSQDALHSFSWKDTVEQVLDALDQIESSITPRQGEEEGPGDSTVSRSTIVLAKLLQQFILERSSRSKVQTVGTSSSLNSVVESLQNRIVSLESKQPRRADDEDKVVQTKKKRTSRDKDEFEDEEKLPLQRVPPLSLSASAESPERF